MIERINFNSVKNLIYSEGRLLERQLFQHFFEGGTKEACFRALLAYQNDDGGFGNGLEPDLLNPGSSGICAETALYIMHVLNCPHGETLAKLWKWVSDNINEQGYIVHPPADLKDYPHQPWWNNPDNERVLSVAGLLKSLGADGGQVDDRISRFASQVPLPSQISFYGYPLLIYALYSKNFPDRQRVIEHYMKGFEGFLEENAGYYPLFGRYWYHAIPLLGDEIIDKHANMFVDSIQDDGGVINPYPDHPYWRSILTLDGLILLRRFNKI